MRDWTAYGTVIAAVMVTILVCVPLAPAFAAGGNSAAVLMENAPVGGDYFAVDVCSFSDFSDSNKPSEVALSGNESKFSESTEVIDATDVEYTISGNNKVIDYRGDNALVISPDNLYLCLWTDSPAGTEYTLDFTATFDTPAGYTTLGFDVVTFGDSQTFKSGYATRIQITAEIYYSRTAAPEDFSVSILLESLTDNVGNVTIPDKPVHILSGNSALQAIIQENNGNSVIGTGSNKSQLISSPADYGSGCEGVRIKNLDNDYGGIAQGGNNSGRVDVQLELPAGKYFMLAIGFTPTNQTQLIYVTIERNGEEEFDETVSLAAPDNPSADPPYTKYYGDNGYNGWSLPSGTTSWLYYSGGTVVIKVNAVPNMHLDPHTTFDLVYKK